MTIRQRYKDGDDVTNYMLAQRTRVAGAAHGDSGATTHDAPDLTTWGGGALLLPALPDPAHAAVTGTEPTPHPPKRPGPDFPCAVPSNIQKNPQKKIITKRQQFCDNCYYHHTDRKMTKITCRASNPAPTRPRGYAVWPQVTPDDWCGQWRPE